MRYGGLDPKVSNVYFTQGSIDPWKKVGIQQNYNEDSPTTVIPGELSLTRISLKFLLKISLYLSGASHMADFGSISNQDSEAMRKSKEKIRQLVIEWFSL